MFTQKIEMKNGRISYSEGQRDKLSALFRGCKDGYYLFSVAPWRPTRSLQANARYWAILQGYADYAGYTPEELHEALKKKLLGSQEIKVFGELIETRASTASLNSSEFREYVQRAELLLAEHYGETEGYHK